MYLSLCFIYYKNCQQKRKLRVIYFLLHSHYSLYTKERNCIKLQLRINLTWNTRVGKKYNHRKNRMLYCFPNPVGTFVFCDKKNGYLLFFWVISWDLIINFDWSHSLLLHYIIFYWFGHLGTSFKGVLQTKCPKSQNIIRWQNTKNSDI